MTKQMHVDPTKSPHRGALLGVAILAAGLLTACGDASETEGSGGAGGTGDTGGMGGAGGQIDDGPMGEWSCLGAIEAPTYAAGPDVDGASTVVDLLGGAPIVGATLTVCASTDTDCASPVSTGTTDDTGTAALTMGTSEGHYVQFSAEGYPDHVAFRNEPPPDDWGLNFTPVDTEGVAQLVGLLGGTPDPERGHVGVTAYDCNGELAPGVIIEIDTADEETLKGYFSPIGIPNPSLPATSTDGRTGIANLPAGPYVVTATVAATGEVISTRRGFVRAGELSYPWQINPIPQATP